MREVVLYHMIAFCLGILLDRIIGDPHGIPHPVRAMGSLISFLEKRLLSDGSDAKKRRAGILLWMIVIFLVCLITLGVVAGTYYLNVWFGVLTEAVLTCYCLAAKSLYRESMAVGKKLEAEDLEGARAALSMIVGRDTAALSEEEVIKASVETVAENASDGVIAPLLYAAAGGPVLSMIYKAVNTMDSMIGYRNEKYEQFGAFAARADDVFNYLPSRFSALCMIAAAGLLGCFDKGYDGKEAFRIFWRDRRKHSSPNSAQTESVCAGALGLQLGGTHLYRGVAVEKPTIGDERRKPEIADIRRANRLMLAAEGIAIAAALAVLVLAAICITGL